MTPTLRFSLLTFHSWWSSYRKNPTPVETVPPGNEPNSFTGPISATSWWYKSKWWFPKIGIPLKWMVYNGKPY